MKLLLALETVMSAGRTVWLNCLIAAAFLFLMAAITDGAGLGFAGRVLTWMAILPLGLGVLGLADDVRQELKAARA